MIKNQARTNNIVDNCIFNQEDDSLSDEYLLLKEIKQNCSAFEDFENSSYELEATALGLKKKVLSKIYPKHKKMGKKTQAYLNIMRSFNSVKEFTSTHPTIAKKLSTLAKEEYHLWKSVTAKKNNNFDLSYFYKKALTKEYWTVEEIDFLKKNSLKKDVFFLRSLNKEGIRKEIFSLLESSINGSLKRSEILKSIPNINEKVLRASLHTMKKTGYCFIENGVVTITPLVKEFLNKIKDIQKF